MGLFIWSNQPSKIFVGNTQISKVFVWDTKVRPSEIVENYTLSNIATNDTNKYINVAKSWYTIQSVKFNFITTWWWAFVHISSNNSNSSRYWVACWYNTSGNLWEYCAIRWRLNGASDTWYRQEWPYNSWTSNTIEFYINRDGNCYISINWTKNSYTAGSAELNIIQTIMNLSNMNCYASQAWSLITGNSIDIKVTYTKDNYSTTSNSLQNINLTPTNEINITPNNNGSGNVQSI